MSDPSTNSGQGPKPVERVRGLVRLMRHQASMATTAANVAAYWRSDANAIEAVLAERTKLQADVERLREACLAVSEDPWPVQPNVGEPDRCGWCQRHVDASSNCHDDDCPVRQMATALAATEPLGSDGYMRIDSRNPAASASASRWPGSIPGMRNACTSERRSNP